MSSPIDRFITEYETHLSEAHKRSPGDYSWPIEYLPVVIDKMRKALLSRTVNKDSRAIRLTCKELDIMYTYKGIYGFIHGDENNS